MKTSGFRCETKFRLLVFLGHPIGQGFICEQVFFLLWVGTFSEEILFVIFHPMTDHKCKVSTQSLSNLHSFFKSGFVCANVPLLCMIWRRRSEQQLTTVIASPSAAIHLSVFFSPMSLSLLPLTCTSFLHLLMMIQFCHDQTAYIRATVSDNCPG